MKPTNSGVTNSTNADVTKATNADQPSRLATLEGVGPQLADSIRKAFRGEAGFFDAVARLDLAALCAVDGVSERKAVDLVRQVLGHDRRGGGFLATPAARKLHDELMDRLAAFASTPSGRNRLRLIGPHANPASAQRAAQDAIAAKGEVALLDREQVRAHLRRIRLPTEPSPRFEATRLIVCSDDATQDRLQKAGVHKWCQVSGAEALAHGAEADVVVVLSDDGIDTADLAQVVELPSNAAAHEACPELLLAWFRHNREVWQHVLGLAQALGRPSKCGEVLATLDQAGQASTSPESLRRDVEAVRTELDHLLQERVAQVSLSGSELLATLGKRLPPALQKAMDEVRAEGRRRVQQRCGVALQPFVAGFPIAIDDAEVERVESGLAARGHLAKFEQQLMASRTLAALREQVLAEVRHWLDYDARFALGCFTQHFDLHPAKFGPGFSFESSIHLDLADQSTAQRITYELGHDANVAILTGANSGGKTTLLEHLAQMTLMARLGLPVVGAGVEVPWVDELHYVTARRGLDAGAFEAFLKSFLPIARGDRRRLVLADEVEAVTELEAASRILGFFVDRIAAAKGSLAVIVSHMAPHVLRHTTAAVRVDGIEAAGIDADNRLVVDRTPRMGHFARSTPELIIRRLAAVATGTDKELYTALLRRFDGQARAPVPVAPPPSPAPLAPPTPATPPAVLPRPAAPPQGTARPAKRPSRPLVSVAP